MDPFEEIRYLGWDLGGVEDFENSPSHSTLSERLKKTLYLTEGCTDGMSLPVADTAVELFQEVSGSPLKKISPRHVANLSKRSRVAPCTLLLAMIYARRLKTMNDDYLQNMTAPDLLLVSMMVASKFLYDEGEDEEMFSDEWAVAANVDLDRVYELEREFLSAMDWNLFVHNEEFFEFVREFETRIALKQGMRRGWFSYSDMEILMAQTGWLVSCRVVMHQAVRVVAACAAVYTVCASTLIWSSLVLHHTSPHGPCSNLWLEAQQVQKSTLMHHPPVTPSLLPPPSKRCLKDTDVVEPEPLCCNASDAVDDCVEDTTEVPVGGVTDTLWELTSALHLKYQAAHSALVIFYQALITSLHDIGGDGGRDDGEACECECTGLDELTVKMMPGSCWGSNGSGMGESWNGPISGAFAAPPCCQIHRSKTTCPAPTPEMNQSTGYPSHCQGTANHLNCHAIHLAPAVQCREKGPHYRHSGHINVGFEGFPGGTCQQCIGSFGCPKNTSDVINSRIPNPGIMAASSCRGAIVPTLGRRLVDLEPRFATISY